jgi:hypothetical protein
MCTVPLDKVNWRCSVKSNRAPRKANEDKATSSTNANATNGNAMTGRFRRLNHFIPTVLIGAIGSLLSHRENSR